MKATGHYTPVVLFMICTGRMVPTFESGNEIQQYDNSNESFWAALSCGTFYYAALGGSNF